MQEVAEGIDDVGLTELVLDETHDVRQVGLSDVRLVNDAGHGGRGDEGKRQGKGFNVTGFAHIAFM